MRLLLHYGLGVLFDLQEVVLVLRVQQRREKKQ